MARTKATTKPKPDYNDPLHISNEMAALDRKDYEYYDKLDDEQKKKFTPYLMLRWGSCVEGNQEAAQYYAVAMNEFANQNFWEINRHKKLQWMACCAASPGIGKQRHYWLGAAKKTSVDPLKKFIMEQFPSTKLSEIDLLIQQNSAEAILEWLQQHGLDNKMLTKILS